MSRESFYSAWGKNTVPILLLEFDFDDRYGKKYVSKFRPSYWVPGMAHDLDAYHSIDVEAELTALLLKEIADEIDSENINVTKKNKWYNKN